MKSYGRELVCIDINIEALANAFQTFFSKSIIPDANKIEVLDRQLWTNRETNLCAGND